MNSKTDIEKINSFSRKKLTESDVYIFTVKLCNNDVDRDYEKFSLAALDELAPLFVGKTGIFDHSMKSADQKARIFDAFVEREDGRTTLDGEPFYNLKAKVYMLRNESNKSLIEEIEAGIKKEVSVSCSMSESRCSVCGKDKRSGECTHKSGVRYGDQLAFTVLGSPTDAYEFSFVAVPAQREAGVTKAFGTKEYDMENVLATIKSCAGEVTLTKAQADEIASYIEELREGAKLGEDYKKMLSKDVAGRLALALPQVDASLLKSVTAVMTVKELLGFKEGLGCGGITPQLAKSDEKQKNNDYSQFRI
ncbi:MAG: hypothetical protein E7571_01635 [Ruminococcaceae bacterium]|nr:hypothetical protein [Oscillospiraceae bacterium]